MGCVVGGGVDGLGPVALGWGVLELGGADNREDRSVFTVSAAVRAPAKTMPVSSTARSHLL